MCTIHSTSPRIILLSNIGICYLNEKAALWIWRVCTLDHTDSCRQMVSRSRARHSPSPLMVKQCADL